ncbi:MAG: metal-sensitive transcriptional regulator [Nitrospinota bacterium]
MVKADEFIGEERKSQILNRLARIEGQVRGLQRMVEEGRYCVEILGQLSAVHEALRGVGKEVMRNYLEGCVTRAIREGRGGEIYDEVMDILHKYAR